MRRFHFVTMGIAGTIAGVAACGGTEPSPIDPGTDAGIDTATGTDATTSTDTGVTPTDAGVVFPDSGIGAPKIIDINFADKCPAPVACGGNVVGTWDYDEACAEGVWDEAKKACPTLGIKNQTGTVQGRVAFSANMLARTVKLTFGAKLNWPSGCLQNGQITCAMLQTTLMKSFTTATCAAANGGCDCDVTTASSGSSNGTPYTLANNQIVGPSGDKWDYCVKGDSMSYHWVGGPNPEKASFTLKQTK